MDFINDISTQSIFEEFKEKYRTIAGKDLQIGSDEFALASVIAYVFGVLIQRFNAQAKQRYLSTATGAYLDALGETFDIARPETRHATVMMFVTIDRPVVLWPKAFVVSDSAGNQFTPMARCPLSASGDARFIGINSQDKISLEHSIAVGAINQIVTPLEGVLSVKNTSLSIGGIDLYPHTDEGDEAYRRYILAERSARSAGGPAVAYERRAIGSDPRIVDAYCLRFSDLGWEAGKAKVYILVDSKLTLTADKITAKNNATAALNATDWRPTCDMIELSVAQRALHTINFTVGISANSGAASKEHFLACFEEYKKELIDRLGESFSLSELARRCQTPKNGAKTEYIAPKNPQHNYIACGKTEALEIRLGEVDYEII